MLERFYKAKAEEIAQLRALDEAGSMPPLHGGLRPSFTGALRGRAPRAVIAEYKRASPSGGDLNLTLGPEEAALSYAEAGAGALSVLTEERYFKGSTAFLDRMTGPGLPLLRKDFIIDPLQVRSTASTPASALLLIVRMLDEDMLPRLIRESAHYGLEAVVEAFDGKDLQRAKAAGARIIQINNRDLDTLAVDTGTSARLIRHKSPDEFWITASGIHRAEQLTSLLDSGFDAALIGSSLMAGPGESPGTRLRTLLAEEEASHAF